MSAIPIILLSVFTGFLGFASAILIHKLANMIVIKILSFGKSDLYTVNDKGLWKQPVGLLLLTPFVGNALYLLLLIPAILPGIDMAVQGDLLFSLNPAVFIFGAIVGNISILLSYPEQIKYKGGELYLYTVIKEAMHEGCDCGGKGLLIGTESIECTSCRRTLCQIEQRPKGAHPLLGSSRSFEGSIAVNTTPEIVFDHLTSPPSDAKVKRLRIRKFRKESERCFSYFVKNIRTVSTLIEARRPEYLHINYRFGANTRDEHVFLKASNGKTMVRVRMELSYPCPTRRTERALRRNLAFMKEEIESVYGK
ncbi:MAG: hypothetical protein KAX31_05095 [Thermoplasmata archaeon]|nr:hypothetical protein [Thermoplasmata archaeon]